MKLHMKIVVSVLLLFTVFTGKPVEISEAAYDYSNLGCTNSTGRDIVFVIQDTPNMPKEDTDNSRVTEVVKLIDQANDGDRFGFVGFDVNITKHLKLTDNLIDAKRMINQFESDVGQVNGNNMSVGLEQAINDLSTTSTSGEKIIVLMTVGESINNDTSLELAAKAYEEDIKIHTITFGDSSKTDRDILKQVASITGGNYSYSPNATFLWGVLTKLSEQESHFQGREVTGDWVLTEDAYEPSGLRIHQNVKVDLNGYDLTVAGDLVMYSCSELRAESGTITAKNVKQNSRSSIRLNNSQLHVTNEFHQDGLVAVNGDFGGQSVPEVNVSKLTQKIHGYLKLNGQYAKISNDFYQEGKVDFSSHSQKGQMTVLGDLHQKGYFNVQGGNLHVNGNLTINGGNLIDDQFTQNKSFNIGGGYVKVGDDDDLGHTGNVKQLSGQLYVNHGAMDIYGDYSIADGWLTMIHGSMDTTSKDYGKGDGDFIHVHGNFTTSSHRNHAERIYNHLMKPTNDLAHLTDGVLVVEGDFIQEGNDEYHKSYSDKSQNYSESYSKYNFNATGRHKVLLTSKGKISAQSNAFKFNILEVEGKLNEYTQKGIKYNRLIERQASANSNLASLSINDIAVVGFNPDVTTYFEHVVPAASFTGAINTLKVDARAQDHRNAKVQVLNNVMNTDGTAEVKVLVTANDGTQKVYTVYVTVGEGSGGAVTSIQLDRKEQLFVVDGSGFRPSNIKVGHTVYPNNAVNQQVTWFSTNPKVASVNPNGVITPLSVGETSIVAKTADGGFTDAVVVKVLTQNDLLEGVNTLADLVSDENRFNQITSGVYSYDTVGIVVPGLFIKNVDFSAVGDLAMGTITTSSTSMPAINRIEVSVNGGIPTNANKLSNGNTFTFTKLGLKVNDHIEVVAYDAVGNELERVSSSYPVNFQVGNPVQPGFYSLERLTTDLVLFNAILDYYAPEQLRFTVTN